MERVGTVKRLKNLKTRSLSLHLLYSLNQNLNHQLLSLSLQKYK
jgi:hypothetical protein